MEAFGLSEPFLKRQLVHPSLPRVQGMDREPSRKRFGRHILMWFFSLDGMLSIVRHWDFFDQFLVRSSNRKILERRFPGYPVIQIEDANYTFRVIVPEEKVLDHLENEIAILLYEGYTNFKDACKQGADSDYLEALDCVWSTMLDYQEKTNYDPPLPQPRRS